jgi:integrase
VPSAGRRQTEATDAVTYRGYDPAHLARGPYTSAHPGDPLRVACRRDREEGILTTNPALGLARQGRKTPDSISQAERLRKIRPLSQEQLASLLYYMHQHCPPPEYTRFLLLADTGMRPGEALALAWEDFDETGRTLHVERAVSLGQVKPTKTEESPSPWVFPNPRG